jgi:hypothetical protein
MYLSVRITIRVFPLMQTTGYLMSGSANERTGTADYTYTLKTTADVPAPATSPVPGVSVTATIAPVAPTTTAVTAAASIITPTPTTVSNAQSVAPVTVVATPVTPSAETTTTAAVVTPVVAPTTSVATSSGAPSTVPMPATATTIVGTPTSSIIPAGTSLDVHVQGVRDNNGDWKLVAMNVVCKETDQKFVYDHLPSSACSVITVPSNDYGFWESMSTTGRVVSGLAAVAGVVLLGFLYKNYQRSTPVRQSALFITTHPRASDLLGLPIQLNHNTFRGTIGDTTCRGTFAVQGSKRKGRVSTQVMKVGNEWQLKYATLELEGSNRAIPLELSPTTSPNDKK